MMKRTPKLGQHFLNASWPARSLAEHSGARAGDTILEIGPGKGILTKELLKTGARVVAVEKDPALVERLHAEFRDEMRNGVLRIVEGDVRDTTPEMLGLEDGNYVLAANIPYYITGDIMRTFLTASRQPRTIVLLVQKEVAERIVSKRESILSLSVKAYGAPRIIARVSRGNFTPPPSVDSAIILISNISRDFFSGFTEETFFKIVRAGFAAKRKLLANNLSVVFGKDRVRATLAECGVAGKARAEDVPLETWGCLTKELIR
jgi:16S rRNA (adenine1518-N6/adenine1519-N6)-dimethyltransferase